MRILLKSILLFFLLPLITVAQKKPIVKVELSISTDMDLDQYGFESTKAKKPFSFFYPIIHVPITKHFDIGAGYNSLKITPTRNKYNSTTFTYESYDYDIVDKFWSLYFTVNFAKSHKTVIPTFSYILSFAKGTADFSETPTIPYTAAEKDLQNKLKNALAKSEISHGIQGGVDIKISNLISVFAKARVYALTTFLNNEKGTAFPILPAQAEDLTLGYRSKFYLSIGGVIKLYSGKKTSIK